MASTLFCDLNGTPVDRARLEVPALGVWHLDVALVTDLPPVLPANVFSLAGSSWTCGLVRSVAFSGQIQARLVGGTGGWRKVVPPRQYASPQGVPLGPVVTELAALVQEPPPVLAPTLPPLLGKGYIRPNRAAGFVLRQLLGDGWWVDPTGIVQTIPRPPTPVVFPFVAEDVRGAQGWYRIATETPAEWMPGATFLGPTVSGTVSRVAHIVQGDSFWTEVLVA